jgi:hypothetical protein
MSDIEKRLRIIKEQIVEIEKILQISKPAHNEEPITKCSVCEMEWKGVMMYSCPNMRCPVQLKTSSYTTIPTTITYQTYNTYEDIESPDPAERSWVYDGFGIRRPRGYE